MAVRPDYTIGTLTLSSGSANFTTSGSALQSAAVQAGDEIITRSGNVLIIASITGQNSGTLMQPCPAAAAGSAQPLRIRFQPDGSRYQGAVRVLIDLLSSGNLEAFAALVGAAGLVPIFTGPGTMDLADPATFGIQDPNGSLGKLAKLALAANKLLNTDANGDILLSDITAKGRSLVAASSNDAALAVIAAAARPATYGRGLFAAFQTSPGAAAVLPAGGSYAFWLVAYEAASGQFRNGFSAGVSAGGSTIGPPVAGWIWSGVYWNLT